MEIQVLGPVGLVAQSRRFGLGSDKERLVLASLALEAGRPVSLDALVGRLWEGDPPANDRKNVQVYVSRIRKALREYGAGPDMPRISHHAHTYALRMDADSIDWHRFQHLTSEARSTADRGDTEAAIDLLHQADDLWRGDALAGLPGLWPERTRRKLAQRRLGVTSSRIALELRLHRFADVVGDLADLVDQHPDDETLIGHLMVAYYGCGRHADALRAYQVALRRLRAELGTEPGEELAHIHQRILRRAPVQDLLPGSAESAGSTGATGPAMPLASATPAGALAATWSAAAPSGAVPPVAMPAPHNLPRQSALIGRHAELRRLSQTVEAVADHGSVVTLESISGMAGIGKTALAINAARHMGDRFPDGQLYLDLRAHARVQEPLEAGQALAMLLRLLGVPADAIPADVEERTALWRTMLARRRVILVLDDAASPSQVIPPPQRLPQSGDRHEPMAPGRPARRPLPGSGRTAATGRDCALSAVRRGAPQPGHQRSRTNRPSLRAFAAGDRAGRQPLQRPPVMDAGHPPRAPHTRFGTAGRNPGRLPRNRPCIRNLVSHADARPAVRIPPSRSAFGIGVRTIRGCRPAEPVTGGHRATPRRLTTVPPAAGTRPSPVSIP
ncbi:BTAD domain-containing putative transcriptional regulator [Streptomyces noursei]|nr:BTAD domain-containing putative transcriptional regulator [Streptomyces noursei]